MLQHSRRVPTGFKFASPTAPDKGKNNHTKQIGNPCRICDMGIFQVKPPGFERLVHVFAMPATGIMFKCFAGMSLISQVQGVTKKIFGGHDTQRAAIDRHFFVPVLHFSPMKLAKEAVNGDSAHATIGLETNTRGNIQAFQRLKPQSSPGAQSIGHTVGVGSTVFSLQKHRTRADFSCLSLLLYPREV